MTQPTPGDVHVNMPLTNVSVAFMQAADAFVADKVFPSIPVEKQSDRYYTYDRGYFNRDEMAVRAPGTESKGGDFTVDNTPTYFAPIYAFHHDIDDQRRANSDSMLQPDREATELVSMKALIKREKLWVSKYFGTGVWTNERAGNAAPSGTQFKFWDASGSTPIEDLRKGITTVLESTGMEPNTLVLGKRVYDALIDNAELIDRVKYNQIIGTAQSGGIAQINTAAIASLLGLQNVWVMKAVENTAKEGQTSSHAFIGGKNALLAYAAPNPGLMTPTAGYTFSWTGYLGAGAAGQRIKRFRMENLASDRIEIEMAFDQKLVSADLGSFFLGAVS